MRFHLPFALTVSSGIPCRLLFFLSCLIFCSTFHVSSRTVEQGCESCAWEVWCFNLFPGNKPFNWIWTANWEECYQWNEAHGEGRVSCRWAWQSRALHCRRQQMQLNPYLVHALLCNWLVFIFLCLHIILYLRCTHICTTVYTHFLMVWCLYLILIGLDHPSYMYSFEYMMFITFDWFNSLQIKVSCLVSW